jgi:energy-coupling factor transport system ATP-binding protein
MIDLDQVGHRWAAGSPWEVRGLRPVSMRISAGERIAVVGPNGSGKSTLAWILGGVVRPTEGAATIDEAALFGSARTGLVLQHARQQLLRATVASDLDLGAGALSGALRRVGMSMADAGRSIDALSGGEQRRVALAAMLHRSPELLVLDEPFAGLDAAGRRLLRDALDDFTGAVVTVTHDLAELDGWYARVVEL